MNSPQPATRILLLVSNPFDNPVNIAGDVAALTDALRDLPAAAEFVVQIAEVEAVATRLARQDEAPFTVLHYLGHGYKPPEQADGALLFENSQGAGRLLDNFPLLATLAPMGTATFQLAILSACHSASVALAMHALHIPHIVAIEADETIYELAAVQFCRRFYQVLLTGGTVDAAFTAGRNAVLLDEQLGVERGRAEAAKFLLLPAGGSHRVSLVAAHTGPPPNLPQGGGTDVAPTHDRLPPQVGEGWGGVAKERQAPTAGLQFHDLPRPRQPYFHDRPRHFVGRTADLQAVLRHLAQERAVVITGVSGVGKTALARETAHWLVARRRAHPDRAYFVPLLTSASAADARRALAIALDLRQELPAQETAANVALARLIPPHALLILDEAENLISQGGRAVRELLETLAQAPNRPLLIVTSQSSLTSSRFPRLALSRLTEVAALELFRLTAGLAWPELTALGTTAVLELLGYVDRLPRAIELVARVWQQWHQPTLQPLLHELRRLHDQIMADPEYPDEVKSVTVGIQLAYDRLRQRDPAATDLYAHLALFPGGVTDGGVTAIFGADAAPRLRLIEGQSLVERPFPDLLYLPTPFRHFAARHLPTALATAQGTLGPAALRFYFDFPDEEHYGWVNQLNRELTRAGEQMGAWINRYETELPSVEAWLDWAYDHEPCAGDQTRGPQLTALLENLYVMTETLRFQRPRLTLALTQAQRCADRAGEANVQKALGDLEVREANLKVARERYLAALAIYPAIGARLGEANVQNRLGDLARAEGDLENAWVHFRTALELHATIDNQLGVAASLLYMGRTAHAATNYAQAALIFDEALSIYRVITARFSEMLTLDDQGDAFQELDLPEAALGAWWQAFTLAQAIGDSTAQRLAGLFAHFAQQMGDDQWRQISTDLATHAEEWRQAGVAAVRQQMDEAGANDNA